MSLMTTEEASQPAKREKPETGVTDLNIISITFTPAALYDSPWVDEVWPLTQFITYDEAQKLYAALGEYLNS